MILNVGEAGTYNPYERCNLCGNFGAGAYVFSNISVCFTCASANASKRGYNGDIKKDPYWVNHTGIVLPEPITKPSIEPLHFVLDLIVVFLLIYAGIVQERKITQMERRIALAESNNSILMEASILLLQDKVQGQKTLPETQDE